MFDILKRIFKPQKKQRDDAVLKAQQEARHLASKVNEEALKIKQETQRALRKATETAAELEKRIMRRDQQFDEKEKELSQEKQRIDSLRKETEQTRETMLAKLEKIAGMTKDQAKQFLLNAWEEKMKREIAKRIKQTEEQIRSQSEEKAKEILVDAMKHGATDYVAEFTLSTISLPNEDFKGRIIGKDGRNIRAFELATGVDVDLEEEGAIKLSSFDAIKREIAKTSLEKLIKDGRIQPQRIEEIVSTTKREIERVMLKAGEELAHKVGIYNLPQEITALLGKFKYRYSYGQNMILHTLEETKIGTALANELKADTNVVKLGCLLHDIGKVVADKEGSHVDLGVELLKKHRFPQKVIDCVAAHHEDVPFSSIEAIIVYIADAVSGGRPGARHEDFEQYLKRIKTIEDIAKTKKGIKEAYALQAGRELRVIVKPEDVSDEEMTIMAQKLKEELEKKFDVFPGQIKITIIRETRAEAVTKI